MDKNYHAVIPPALANPTYPDDGKLYELLLTLQTGADDLRGGNDNLDLTLNLTSGAPQVYRNINLGSRWISNYEETECVVLSAPVLPSQIANVVLATTFGGGIGGDNWDLQFVEVRGKGGGNLDLKHLAQGGPHRFTGNDRTLTLPASTQPLLAKGLADQLQLRFQTGGDDLRGGNDNVNVVVAFRGGGQLKFDNVNRSRRWADHSVNTVLLPIVPPVRPTDLVSLTLTTTFGGGLGGDNWNMDGLEVLAVGNGIARKVGGYGYMRFTGSSKILFVNLAP